MHVLTAGGRLASVGRDKDSALLYRLAPLLFVVIRVTGREVCRIC